MKTLFLLSILFLTQETFSQNQFPLWSYTYPASYTNAAPSKSGKILGLFQELDPNCISNFSTAILLDPVGNLIWKNTFDTTDFCNFEDPFTCTVIEGATEKYSINSKVSLSPNDSDFTITYDIAGNILSKYYSGDRFSFIGDMDNDFIYSVETGPFRFSKTNSVGNIIWTQPADDSINVISVRFSSHQNKIIAGCGDYSQSDNFSRFIIIDTTGTELHNITRNIFLSTTDYPDKVWLTPDYKILTIVKSATSIRHALLLDTAGNLIWESADIQNFRSGDYDSITNRLHVLVYTSAPSIETCYKIDASTGFVIDSIRIDSCANPFVSVKVDKFGYCYLGYRQTNTNAVYRVERYKPNYSLDWTGEISDTLNPGPFNDIFINDSGFVYLIHSNGAGTAITKFAPPIISSVGAMNLTNSFTIFPTPSFDKCFYQLSNNLNYTLRYEIYDASGRVVLHGKCSDSGNGEIDISALQPSFYFLSISNEKGELMGQPKKIIKL